MNKITLTEMPNTVVNCVTEEEAKELMQIYDNAGWAWVGDEGLTPNITQYNKYGSDTCYRAEDEFGFGNLGWYVRKGYKIITLKEFKKLQGIGVIMSKIDDYEF